MEQMQNKENLKISKEENRKSPLGKQDRLKSIFYAAVFCFLCICDQRRGSAPGHTQLMFVNLTWAAVLLLQFGPYKVRDFLKVPYFFFTGVFLVAIIVLGGFREGDLFFERFFVGQWYAGCLCVWLFGLLLIRDFMEESIGKKKEKVSLYPVFVRDLFVLSMMWAFGSNRNMGFALMVLVFGCLYFQKRTKEDEECLLNNLSNGIIFSFFLIQGQAFVFRPFDTLRYNGMYANPNMNGLYYMLVYCACLRKYCFYYTKHEGTEESELKTGKRVKKETWIRWFFLLLGASLWAFTLFTQCRSGLLGMAAATAVAGIYCLMMRGKQVIKNGACMVGGLLLCIAITMPISYLAVRYLPPFFHHPIWFEGEYSEEKVHSWDPYDSPKFTNYRQIIESFTGRLYDASGQSVVVEIQAPAEGTKEAVQAVDVQADTMQVDAAQNVTADTMQADAAPKEDKPTPVFDYEEENSLKIRKAIYSHYLSNLGLNGHKEEENGLQVTPNYFAPHAHNLFLQFAFSYGIIAGVLFLVWVLVCLVVMARQAFKEKRRIEPFLFELAIVLFGMMEIMWRTGQLSLTLLFLLPMFACNKEK